MNTNSRLLGYIIDVYIEEVPLFPTLICISGLYHLMQVAMNGTMLKNQKVLENSSSFFNLMEIEV